MTGSCIPAYKKIGDKPVFLFAHLLTAMYSKWVGGYKESNQGKIFYVRRKADPSEVPKRKSIL